MKTQTQFKNASLVSVVNGSIVVKDSTGGEHTFVNASVVSVNNGTIIIESKWVPKKGELIKLTGCHTNCYCIYRMSEPNRIYDYGYKKFTSSVLYTDIDDLSWCTVDVIVSSVTPKEQKEFDDFCKSQGKIWNKEKLQWEKYKWKPVEDQIYYSIFGDGLVYKCMWNSSKVARDRYALGNCFKTKEQAEKVAEKVKELLKSL